MPGGKQKMLGGELAVNEEVLLLPTGLLLGMGTHRTSYLQTGG